MRIDISDIRRQIGSKKHVEFDFMVESPIGETRIVGPLRVSLDLVCTGKAIAGTFTVAGTISDACARCLREIERPFQTSFSEEFRSPSEEQPDEDEEFFTHQGDEIDPSDAIWQNVVLAVPSKMVCSPSCKGLCPECGADLNIGPCSCSVETSDERWGPLRNLLRRS